MKLRLLLAVFALALVLTFSWAQNDEEYIVALRPGQAIRQFSGAQIVRTVPGAPILLIRASSVAIGQIKLDKAVESVEKNVGVNLRSRQEVALSPSLAEQQTVSLDDHTLTTFYWTNVLKSYVNQPALTLTRVDAVRGISTGAGTRIAYIDTGVDPNHPALQPWLDPGIDLVFGNSASELDGLSQQMASLLDQQMASLLDKRFMFLLNQAMASLLDSGPGPDTFPPDLGHGTMVAGILHVVAPGARIVPIKAFDAYGFTTMFTITDAVYRAKSLGVDVLNMSFSTTENSFAFRKAVVDALASGIAVVTSVGNEARGITNTDLYPASYGSVYGVAATDFNDRLASFSNYGIAVDVAAPGSFVISTAPNGRYAAAWGTSFSAPLVSGTIALAARSYGQADGMRVVSTADNIDKLNPGFQGKLGRGRINALAALRGPQ